MEPIAAAVAGVVGGAAVGWIVKARLARNEMAAASKAHDDVRWLIEEATEHLGQAVKADVNAALRDSGGVLVGMADENFQKSVAAAKGELDRKHQTIRGSGEAPLRGLTSG